MKTALTAGCLTRLAWPTEAAARQAARFLRGRKAKAYRCRFGHGWHLTEKGPHDAPMPQLSR